MIERGRNLLNSKLFLSSTFSLMILISIKLALRKALKAARIFRHVSLHESFYSRLWESIKVNYSVQSAIFWYIAISRWIIKGWRGRATYSSCSTCTDKMLNLCFIPIQTVSINYAFREVKYPKYNFPL